MDSHPPGAGSARRSALSRPASVPEPFFLYAIATTAAAAVAIGSVSWAHAWRVHDAGLFWMLALFACIGELLPIPVPHRAGLAKVTVSASFTVALLLRFGPGPAAAVSVGSLILADTIERVSPVKVVFNAAQYALAMLAGAAVLTLTHTPWLTGVQAGQLPAILAAALAFFAVNYGLAGIGAALLAGLAPGRYLRDDLPFQAWIAGCLLAFAPVVLAAGDMSAPLVAVAFVPVLAIYVGGRQAVLNGHRAHHDTLTDLPNRLLLSERLHALLDDEPAPGLVSLLVVDLDDFTTVNDTLGHEFGDLVIREAASRLREAVQEPAMLARLGGDEFAVLVQDGQAVAEPLARRLLAALESPLEVGSLSLHVAASVGIACYPVHGRGATEVLRHADVAMHCAKASETGVEVYAEEHDEHSLDRLALAAQLRRGLDRGELVVHYQPKVPLHQGVGVAVEALVRWDHPQLGRIGPDGFIPLAEQTGIIRPLTERVLERALHQCGQWRSEGLEVTMSVNVSIRSLLEHDLPGMIGRALSLARVPASALALEITESRTVADLRRARVTLEELRAMGVMIAIDDFGTGFSSLSQLQQLPIDEIKIDRSFVAGMENDRGDAVLVRSIIELGRNLGMRVTAEGVESEGVQRRLSELGCDYAQGFHLGRPTEAEECRRHLVGGPPPEPARLKLA